MLKVALVVVVVVSIVNLTSILNDYNNSVCMFLCLQITIILLQLLHTTMLSKYLDFTAAADRSSSSSFFLSAITSSF